MIQSRLRFLMGAMAIGIPAWSALEVHVFSHKLWLSLLSARVLVGFSLIGLLVFENRLFGKSVDKLWRLYLGLGVIFVIPTLFYVYCVRLPEPLFAPMPFAEAVASTYFLFPLVILAGIGFFPLTIIESATIAMPFLTAYYLTTPPPDEGLWSPDFGMLWVIVLIALMSMVICISQLRTLVELVSYSAYDLLTNCLGRRSGEEIFKILWNYSVRKKSNLAVAFVDLDNFKQVNDKFGHEIGDKVLAQTATAMKNSLRKSDPIIRWGGEEFLVVLPDANLQNAARTMQRIAETGFGKLPDGTPQTFSVGISERLNETINDANALIQIADQRLYEAKKAGRSCIVGAERLTVKRDSTAG
ncbi:MAG: GGDEF domain-containing protein [Alphaproteobacteria bacterium]|nr:GGDEF domain-containing protein [Alphaproteobacteria bacterium]